MWSCRNLAGLWNTPPAPSFQQENHFSLGHLLLLPSPHMCVWNFVFQWKGGSHKYEVACMARLVQPVSNSYGSLAYIEWDSFGATIPSGPRLHYPTFLDLCLTHEWISCSNWVIAPSNLYTTYWMAVADMSWQFARQAVFQGQARMACIWAENTSRCSHNMAQHAVWNWF